MLEKLKRSKTPILEFIRQVYNWIYLIISYEIYDLGTPAKTYKHIFNECSNSDVQSIHITCVA